MSLLAFRPVNRRLTFFTFMHSGYASLEGIGGVISLDISLSFECLKIDNCMTFDAVSLSFHSNNTCKFTYKIDSNVHY